MRRQRHLRVEALENRHLLATFAEPISVPHDTPPIDTSAVVAQTNAAASADQASVAEASGQAGDEAPLEGGVSAAAANELPGIFAQLGAEDFRGFSPDELADMLRDLPGAMGIESGDTSPQTGIGLGDAGTPGMNDIAEAIGGRATGPEDLGLMPDPTTSGEAPANTRGGPPAAPLGPSYNPADWLSGLASGDDEPDRLVKYGEVQVNDDGSTSTTTVIGYAGTESADATEIIVFSSYSPDGSQSETVLFRTDDGLSGYFEDRDAAGRVVDEGTLAPDRLYDPDGAPADGAWARWLADMMGVRPDLSLPHPDQTNPEQPETTGVAGPTLDPGESIVVNPASPAQQGREVSRDRAAHWRHELLARAGGLVNPPGEN